MGKKSINRKQEIVDTAKELIITQGVQGVTIKKLAQKNDISEAAIYRHFPSKKAILVALIDNFEASLLEAIESPIRKYENPLVRLRGIMKSHMLFTEKKKGLFFALTAESIHFNDDFLRRKVLGVIGSYKSKIKDILIEAHKQDLIVRDVNLDAVSLTFFGLIQAAIIQFALTNYKVPPISKFNVLWKIFLRGIAKETVDKKELIQTK